MTDLLVGTYMDDLEQGSVAKQITAARGLGDLGANAKAALPALRRLVEHADESLSAAAKQAIESISK